MGEAKRRMATGTMPPNTNTACHRPAAEAAAGTPMFFGEGIPYPGYTRGVEVTVLDWTAAHCNVIVGIAMQPGDREMLRRGPLKVGLLWRNGVIFLVLSWHGLTIDLPYSAGLLPRSELPPYDALCRTEQTRLALTLLFVDARTGLGCGARFVTVSPQFTRRLVAYARNQAPTTRQEHELRIAPVYRSYPTATLMLAAAELVETGGQ